MVSSCTLAQSTGAPPSLAVVENLSDAEGRLVISELDDGQFRIEAEPSRSDLFVPRKKLDTRYPLSLIRQIFDAKGVAWACDEIARDEDPNYVAKYLFDDLFAYFEPAELNGARILDFGCGSGASTAILARAFPDSRVIGVELCSDLLAIARSRVEFHRLSNVDLHLSPSNEALPDRLGHFDFVILSAVYEHLLPAERPVLLKKLWACLKPGGYLFVDQTPNRIFPFELHTTMLPLINYLPDKLAHLYARKYSRTAIPAGSWEALLRSGIRGATVREILATLRTSGGVAELQRPNKAGCKDRVDLWLRSTNRQHLFAVKRAVASILKVVDKLSGVCVVPLLALAIRKGRA
jgi:SAM-dependent methyltransferase